MRFSWLIPLLIAVGVGEARASDAPLLVLSGARAEAQAVALGVKDVVRRDGGAFVDLRPAPQAPSQSALNLGRAVAAYQKFDYGLAMGHLQEALEEAESRGALGLSSAELSDLYIYRAMVKHGQGNASAVWEDFVQAATIDPTRHLDAVRFSPSNVASFERARTQVSEAAVTQLRVSAEAGCSFFIDGRPSSLDVDNQLARGTHLLRLDCGDRPSQSQRILLLESKRELVWEVPPASEPSQEQVLSLCRERGFEHVIWAQVRAGKAIAATGLLRLLHCEGAQIAQTSISLQSNATARQTTRLAIGRLLDALEPEVLVPLATPVKTAWYRRPWLWATVGALTATAVLLPFALRDEDPVGFDVRLGGQGP